MTVGGIDVMQLGVGPAKIAQIVEITLRRMITSKLLYPNKITKIFSKTFNKNSTMDVPHGVLRLRVIQGIDLVVMDLTTSDPYLQIVVGSCEKFTSVIYSSL